jgi:hypothetical protein
MRSNVFLTDVGTVRLSFKNAKNAAVYASIWDPPRDISMWIMDS